MQSANSDGGGTVQSTVTATPAPPRRLNVGCGHDIRAGWINLDSAELPGVDVVADLNAGPLPFEDNSLDEILCQDVLEHVELARVLRELHRVLRPGGRLHIRVPHFTSRNFFVDPTHVTPFSIDTLRFFVAGSEFNRGYYFDFSFSGVAAARITFFPSRFQPWNRVVEPAVNRSINSQRYYEGTFLSRMFPALNVEATLIR